MIDITSFYHDDENMLSANHLNKGYSKLFVARDIVGVSREFFSYWFSKYFLNHVQTLTKYLQNNKKSNQSA